MRTWSSDFGLLSLVIPLYNEAQNIPLLVAAIDDALNGFDYEFILVDDGSTDDTFKELQQLSHPNCILIQLDKNYGQSVALAAGIDHAQGEYIITLDGDLQNDPDDIPMMLQKAKNEHWDVVAGIRTHRKDPILKIIPSKIANFIIRKSTKLDIKDLGCALKVFTKDTAKNLKLYGGMHRFILLLAHLNGVRITQVEVHHNARTLGVSKYGLERIFSVVTDLVVLLTLQKSKEKSLSFFDRWILRNYNAAPLKTRYRIKNSTNK